MPHNRTRIWAGLAIVAVTIPAVGLYTRSSAGQSPANDSIAYMANGDLSNAEGTKDTKLSSGRDYQAEVEAALAHRGGQTPKNPGTQGTIQSVQTGPLEVPIPSDSPVRTASNRTTPTTVARTSDIDPNVDNLDNTPPDNGGLSDRTVYNIVVDNLSPDDRDTFEKSWALMSPQDRADMLDQFRANLQSK